MATLVLQTAGQAVGGFLGGPVGAMLGRAAGGIAGSMFDQALFGSGNKHIEGPRLNDLQLMSSTQGAPIPKLYGRARVSGQIIWATRFNEVASTRSQKAGGKGSIVKPKTKITEYAYYANFAVAFCEGTINSIGRVWADGKEIDISQFTWRLYKGDEDQLPDSLIVAKQGIDNAPAFRGTAYIVFENLPLERFGNRLPQLSFEVFKSLDDVEGKIKAVNIIPGATEFGYDTDIVSRTDGWGGTIGENAHTVSAHSDWSISMDQLQDTCQNVSKASLVVSWFGDDLRCGDVLIKPRVETSDKQTTPHTWRVSGQTRLSAQLVSQVDGHAAFGSTPDDGSVVRAIQDLKARGIEPVFYPFIMMDIASDNQLPDPYGLSPNQPAYPWRGRITCAPAPNLAGSPDQTAQVTNQIDSFFGNAQSSDFQIVNGEVIYTGVLDWGYRRMVLHYAHLCAVAGGVNAFLIGSELRGLTRLRDHQNNFPVVQQFIDLANDVSQILPEAKISYAADWSEYFGYHPSDGSGDVFFHLDALWASSNIDFIGIDNYMPLSDWRDGYEHLDLAAGAGSIYDKQYLRSNIAGGEGFNWFYASNVDRELQNRTPITDGAYAKPWVFRYKDIVSWWNNSHFNRLNGIEQAMPTAWLPQSKPIWFTEIGCPAIDKGTNQPNVFYDPKSVESQVPYFSNGQRDDYIQRCYLDTVLDYWSISGVHNPVSSIYGSAMVELSGQFVWAWDARPFPSFPHLTSVWADGDNYKTGHWINARLGAAPLAKLVASILDDYGFDQYDVSQIHGVVDGFIVDRNMSARQALETITSLFSFDAVEAEGQIKFRRRNEAASQALVQEKFVVSKPEAQAYELTRAQETDLPDRLQMLFISTADNYQQASVDVQKLTGQSARELLLQAPVLMSRELAQKQAAISLHELWAAREKISFALPPSYLGVEVGDTVEIAIGSGDRTYRINEIIDGEMRQVTASQIDIDNYSHAQEDEQLAPSQVPPSFNAPFHVVLDLPLLNSNVNPNAQWIATRALPWPGQLALLEETGGGYEAIGVIDAPSTLGQLQTQMPAGPLARIDYATKVRIKVFDAELSSISLSSLLSGGNLMAIGDEETGWEIIQYQNAIVVGDGVWDLSVLLRGQLGSDGNMLAVRPVGSKCVLLNSALVQIPTQASDIGRARLMRLGPSGLDHAHPAYLEFENEATGLALSPLSPVHLSARQMSDHLALSWVRRTRVDADSWAFDDVPLGEASENYVIEIMSDDTPANTVIRTIHSSVPNLEYTNIDRLADFGTPLPSGFTFRVAQISQTVGAGTFTERTFYV